MVANLSKTLLFLWLMLKGRIKVRMVLFKQHIVNDELCPFGCKEKETVQHLALDCQQTQQILAYLEIQLTGVTDLEEIYLAGKEQVADNKRYIRGTWLLLQFTGASG
jgi:hypothetical protein